MAKRVKTLWMKPDYLGQILDGRKSVEVRVGYDNIRRLKPGDELLLNGLHSYAVMRVGHYASFREMLLAEKVTAIAADATVEELLAHLREMYPPEKELLGVVALEIRRAE